MIQSRARMGQVISSALMFAAAAVVVGACAAGGDPSEDVAEAQQADVYYVASPKDPDINASCMGTMTREQHNPHWPNGEDGACSATPSYTVDDAVLACDGHRVKYFGYYCGNYWGNKSGWTAYYACCCNEATTILFETRYFARGSADVTSWQDAQARFSQLPGGAGYGSTMLQDTGMFSNHYTFPGGSVMDIAYHLKIALLVTADQVGDWEFRLGADYGRGGALMVDEDLLEERFPPFPHGFDFNWTGSFDTNNPSLFLKGHYKLNAGLHVIESYGFEDGYDELYANGYQFRLEAKPPGGAWAPVTASVHAIPCN